MAISSLMRSGSLSILNLEKKVKALSCGEPPPISLTALFWRAISFFRYDGYVDPKQAIYQQLGVNENVANF